MKNKLIDIHTHLIYGVDDGARNLEESLKLIKMAMDQGVVVIIATPHSKVPKEEILTKAEIIKKLIKEEDIKLYVGHEIFYSSSTIKDLKKGKLLTLANSRYILVEFDVNVSFNYLKIAIRDIEVSGYIPILAHVERYYCLRKIGKIDEIVGLGALLQMNYESLYGSFFSKDTNWCKRQVKAGKISFLATDMHRVDFRRPEITKALLWLNRNVEEYMENMIYASAYKIIVNTNRMEY